MATLKEEGQKIAEQLGHGVVYKGPWLPYGPSGEFYGHFFEDDAVTVSSFVAFTLEEAKEALTKVRKDFGAEPPVFPDNPLEPWQMPKEKFIEIYLERFKSMLSKEAFARVTKEELQKEREEAIDYQKHTIRQALEAGRPVPPEVLRDYPDIPRFSEAVPEVIPKGEFVRVTVKAEGKRQRSFWAIKDVETPIGNIYVPVDKEGAPSIRYEKDVAIETKDLIARDFIIKEQIAHLDRTYGILKLGRLEPPTAEELGRPPAVGGNPDNTWTCPQCRTLNQIYPYPTRCSHCGYLRKVEKDNFRASNLTPMSPWQGPPLPQVLGIRWPWRKNGS